MKQVLIRKGELVLERVPDPTLDKKEILVQVVRSCVSAGTEVAGVKMSKLPLYQRALKQPHHVKRVIQIMKDQGVKRTWDRITGMLSSGTATGYSAAGTVLAVGDQVESFQVGDRVACAGAGIANHAELISVPVNLAVKIPSKVSFDDAATVTLGAIAMQGVRRAAPSLGEVGVVIGLGILGQLTVQMLLANGCKVIGVDVDNARVEEARIWGMNSGINPKNDDLLQKVNALTQGQGADFSIITAAGTSNHAIISQAMKSCRRKGRVVIVGDVGLNLQRHEFYAKELDVLISCSYGPGRYDEKYEKDGQDYPISYVRWTENRNMQSYLDLISSDKLNISGFSKSSFSLENVAEAYDQLQNEGPKPLLTFLAYDENCTEKRDFETKVWLRNQNIESLSRKIRVAVVGAGGFATGVHLPNLVKLRESFEIRAICSKTGANSLAVSKQFSADYATSDFQEVLSDPDVDLVILCTRHSHHAIQVKTALESGKRVFVEKPLALTWEELEEIATSSAAATKEPFLMVGYNRRYAPCITKLKKFLNKRSSPIMVNYRMNAGYIPPDHWVHGPEGGGRNLGEACHIYDLFDFLTDSEPEIVSATPVADANGPLRPDENFQATIRYKNGSVCSLTYTAMGSKTYPKEMMEVYSEGTVAKMSDFRSLVVEGANVSWKSPAIEKGQIEEMKFLRAVISGEDVLPDPFQACRTALQVEDLIRG